MATTVPILEPLSTGDIIDRSVGIYRRHFRALLATVTLPFLVGVLGWLLIEFGQSMMVRKGEDEPVFSAFAVILSLVGIALYFAYAYMMVLAVAGLSRSVGDYIMLGTPITFRASVLSIRSRLGTLTLASLYLLAAGILISIVFTTIFVMAIFVVALVVGALAALNLPPVVAGVISVIVVFVAMAAVGLFVVPFILSFVIFVPQAIMIEGCSASTALSRAMSLGKHCWKTVLGILVFSYCTSFSIAAAVFIPIGLLLWLGNLLDFDLDTFNAINGGVSQFSSFLVVPVWAISYTLLYFDSRVRKEGYDVDLLARRLPQPPPTRGIPRAPRPNQQPSPFMPQQATGMFPPTAQPFGRLATPNRYELDDSPPYDPMGSPPAASTYDSASPDRLSSGAASAPPSPYLGVVASTPPSFGASAPRPKFSEDGRCLRCGRVNMFASPNCPSCGW